MDWRLRGPLASRLLDRLSRGPFGPEVWGDRHLDPQQCGWNKLDRHFGPAFRERVRDRNVAEYGSASGLEALAIADVATSVTGYEVRAHDLAQARALARHAPDGFKVRFMEPGAGASRGPFDVIFSIDTFEHFRDPGAILRSMYRELHDKGAIVLSFGPTWLHPYGAHMHAVTRVPWVHLIFADDVVLERWNRIMGEHAASYEETGDGLNRMTIAAFRHAVQRTGFFLAEFRARPIRRTRVLQRIFPEAFTSSVYAVLVKDHPYAGVPVISGEFTLSHENRPTGRR